MRRKARADVLAYVDAIDVPGRPANDDPDTEQFEPVPTPLAAHHRLILERAEATSRTTHGRLMIFTPPGAGKALALDTPVPTPDGWTTMGELRTGDHVFDENGHPCNVTWVSQVWRDRPVYRVRTDCGDEIVADAAHEWLVCLCRKRPVFKLRTSICLARKRTKRPLIQHAKALELPPAELPVEPYLLGVWLGDGHSAGMRITAGIEDQRWLRAELARLGIETSDSTVPTLFGVLRLRGAFVSLGLINDPWHATRGRKHIPAIYLRASREQRLHLLQGLIDSDGWVCKRKGATTFSNTNRELAEGVRELVRSLGVKAGWSVKVAKLHGKICGTCYEVSFYLKASARLPRKACLCRDAHRTPNTYVEARATGFADTICIEVDSPSHLYLAGRSMTPTHNSTYASVVFPSRYLGAEPDRRLILASYGDALASRMGRRTRSIIRQARYEQIWRTRLAEDSHAAHAFALTNGSEYLACGILAGVTGNRADGIVLDDPVRGREQANSEVVRDKVFEAYEDDLKTRLAPGGWIVLIGTRWHEDDLAGRILPETWNGESGLITCRDGDTWEVLCFQARCESGTDPLGRAQGEYLWPEWFTAKHWAQFEASPRTWASLYQQMPVPPEGDLFRPEQLVPVDIVPADFIEWVRGWDLASVEGDGDWTAGAKLGRLADGRFVIGDVTRGRWGPDRRDAIISGTANLDGARIRISLPQDPGQAGKTQVLYLSRQLAGYRVVSSPETGDKVTRAEPFAAQVNAGNVLMLRGPWNAALVNELRLFPFGAHDDQVDALSRAFAQLIVRRPMRISDAALASV